MADKILTVAQLNNYIKSLVDNDLLLCAVSVRGEISNFVNHKSGHFYLSIKDSESNIKAVMFRYSNQKLKFVPQNGMKVIVYGRVSVFERDGQYQLYIEDMVPDGIGSLYLAYEQLKEKLKLEGLFDERHKKPLPKIPKTIGIVTSPTGAAVRDMIDVTGRRFPMAKILLYPTLVQGTDAPKSIINAIKFMNANNLADVLIVGRGGGSIEDLWAFNDEGVARAVFNSKIPIVSAVGHETDWTICDFVADLRAPTPSAAAELCVPNTFELIQKFANVNTHLTMILSKRLELAREKVTSLSERRVLQNPLYVFDNRRMKIEFLSNKADNAFMNILKNKQHRFANVAAKLDTLSPLSVLTRGYSFVRCGDKVISKKSQVNKNDLLTINVSDGTIEAKAL